jgi:O-antigen ligase
VVAGLSVRFAPRLGAVAALAVSCAAASIAAFAGVDPQRSFWGFLERQDGLVLWLHFAAWSGLVAWFFRSDPLRLHRYLRASFWVSGLAALTALAEWLIQSAGGEAPFAMRSIIEGRPAGVFGNPVAIGPYLLFHLFYGVYFFGSASKVVRTAIVAVEALSVAVIFLGQTRGVILGLAAGVFVLALAAALRGGTRRLRFAGIAAVSALLIAPAGLWAVRGSFEKTGSLGRLLYWTESASSIMRRITWRSALSAFPDRPFLGWGHDNVYYALNRYYDPSNVRFNPKFDETRATWYDKSHSAYVDLLVEKGIAGALLFALALAVVARGLWRLEDRRLALVLAAALVAYLASNAVAFDTFGSMFGLFLMAGCVDALGPGGENARGAKRPPGWAAALVAAAVAAGLYVNLQIALAVAGYREAQEGFARDPSLGVATYRSAFARFSPYHGKEKLNCAYMIVNALVTGRPLGDRNAAAQLALKLADEAASEHPADAVVPMILTDLYNSLALYGDPNARDQSRKLLERAEAEGRRALELSPKRQEVMIYLGRTYILLGQPERAVALNRGMVDDWTYFPLAHWLLGLSLLENKEPAAGCAEIRAARQFGYQYQNPREAEVVRARCGE